MTTFQSDVTILTNDGASMTAYGEAIAFVGEASDVAIAARIVAQSVPAFMPFALDRPGSDLAVKLLTDLSDKLQAIAEQL